MQPMQLGIYFFWFFFLKHTNACNHTNTANKQTKTNKNKQTGNCHVIANGEIYNHRQLGAKYGFDKDRHSDSDCEIILHLYHKFGKNRHTKKNKNRKFSENFKHTKHTKKNKQKNEKELKGQYKNWMVCMLLYCMTTIKKLHMLQGILLVLGHFISVCVIGCVLWNFNLFVCLFYFAHANKWVERIRWQNRHNKFSVRG